MSVRLWAILLLLLPLLAFAQEPVPDPFKPQPVDLAKPAPVLEEVVARLVKAKAFEANFLLTRYPKDGSRPQKTRGRLVFDNNLGLLWQVQEPARENLWLSVSGLYRLTSQGPELIGPDPGILPLLQDLASARLDKLSQSASLTFGESKEEWELTAKSSNGPAYELFSSVKVRGNRAVIFWIQIERKEGEILSLRLYNLQRFPESMDKARFFFIQRRVLDSLLSH